MKVIGRMVWGHEVRRRHVAAAVTGLASLVLILAWDLLPDAGLRWGIAKALRGLGMVEVSIDDTDISLFGGRLTVRKVVAQPALGKALGIGDFDLKFRWKPLLDRRLVLEHVAAEGIDIDLKREEGGGFVLNGLPLAIAATPPSAKESSPWGIDVAGLELTNSRLHITDGDFTADIAVERLLVENLSSLEPGRAVSFTLKGSLNGAAIALSGTVHPFAAEPSFAAAAQIQRLALADFATLAARAGVTGLDGQAELSLSAEGTLRTDSAAVKLNGRLGLDAPALGAPAAVKAARLELDIARLAWDGGKLELAGALRTETLAVNASGVAGSAGRLDLDLGGLSWDGAKAEVSALKIAAETLAVSAPGGKGSAAKLAIDLKTLDWDGTGANLAGRMDGTTLAGKGEGGEGAAATLALDAKRLDWDGGKLGWQGSLKVAGARIAVAGHDAAPDSLDWSGRLDLDTADLAGKAEGKLALGPLRLGVGDIRTALRAAEAEGKVEFGKAVAADLPRARLEGLGVQDAARKVDWVAVERIEAEALRLDKAENVSVVRLTADGLHALRKEGQGGYSWRIEGRRLHLGNASRDAHGDIGAGEVRIDGLLARLNRTPEGLVGFTFDDKDKGTKTKGAAKKDGDTPAIRIGRLVIGGDSRVNLRDRTMTETVRVDITPLELSIANLDSKAPDRDSPFEIKAGVGRGVVAVAGTVRPLADKISGRLDGKITAFELPPLSPYLAEALGVHLQSGHFDGSLGVGADQGKLSGALDVALSNLFIAPPDPNAPLTAKAGMPIETVLDLLRDGDDRIRLSLPIRGDTANPDLDISDAVAQAVAGALKSTVLTTLKLAFPVVALIEMAVDDDAKSHLALAPLTFAPGIDALTAEQEKTLAGIADLLKGRPGLRLTLCGKADDSDWPVVAARRRSADKPLLSKLEQLVGYERSAESFGPPDRNMLAALAQRRTDAVRNHLVDKAGIETGRLFGCRPMVEAADKGPRVELLL